MTLQGITYRSGIDARLTTPVAAFQAAPRALHQQPQCTGLRASRGIVCRSSRLSWSGEGVSPPAKGSHFLHIDDFSKEELVGMLKTARDVKARVKENDQSFKPFAGKSLAMIFTKPSMRTRVSFETVRLPVFGCGGWGSCGL